MYLGKNIKYLSKQLKINQLQLSEKLGIGQSTISGWVNNASFPEYQMLLKLREILDVNMHDLIYTDLSIKVILSDNQNSLQEPQAQYKTAHTEGVGDMRIEIIESERQLYERIINSKDEMIHFLKQQLNNLQKGE